MRGHIPVRCECVIGLVEAGASRREAAIARKKIPRRGGWFLPLPVELKTCTPATRSAWPLAIFRRKLRVAILCSLSG